MSLPRPRIPHRAYERPNGGELASDLPPESTKAVRSPSGAAVLALVVAKVTRAGEINEPAGGAAPVPSAPLIADSSSRASLRREMSEQRDTGGGDASLFTSMGVSGVVDGLLRFVPTFRGHSPAQ
jgi:hypothetical protein